MLRCNLYIIKRISKQDAERNETGHARNLRPLIPTYRKVCANSHKAQNGRKKAGTRTPLRNAPHVPTKTHSTRVAPPHALA